MFLFGKMPIDMPSDLREKIEDERFCTYGPGCKLCEKKNLLKKIKKTIKEYEFRSCDDGCVMVYEEVADTLLSLIQAERQKAMVEGGERVADSVILRMHEGDEKGWKYGDAAEDAVATAKECVERLKEGL